ncbi:Na+/H+ antiporter NhaA [Dyadobacter sp. MSC1_007]|jgi:NhaA family Na+:H+ antiporter|uniref:Na+/H+ antiporter NhaA n=1 Tax=Dyadobacter sp. MSC1_007 TaxID=2909264 RepID=UPI00202E6BD3|nr:Na+/H+ antiporter NhaA [Dyadobacter sp. MSC1_007]
MMARSPIDRILHPVIKFIHQEFMGGIILFIHVIISIAWVNSSWSDFYRHLWETKMSVGFSDFKFNQPLHIWINDGLMAIFFFVIGLELTREYTAKSAF